MAIRFRTRAIATSAALTVDGSERAIVAAFVAAYRRLSRVAGDRRPYPAIRVDSLPRTGDDLKYMVEWTFAQ